MTKISQLCYNINNTLLALCNQPGIVPDIRRILMKTVNIILIVGAIAFSLLLLGVAFLDYLPIDLQTHPLPTEAEINTIVEPPLKTAVREMIKVLETCQKPTETGEVDDKKYQLLLDEVKNVYLFHLRYEVEYGSEVSMETRPVISKLYEAALFKLRWVNQQEIPAGWANEVCEQLSEYLERLESDQPNPRTKPAFDWLNPEHQPSPPSREGSFFCLLRNTN